MNGRDEKGRFVKGHKNSAGNKGGTGRPRRSIEERYLKALSGSISISDWKEIVKKAVEQAKDGDKFARQWLADYLIGKPTQYVNADISGGLSLELTKITIYEYGDTDSET